MIRGMTVEKSDVTKVLMQYLEGMPHIFMLTGSRFFGTFRPNSDWDFFTQDDRDCEQRLKNLGFEVLHSTSYQDYEITRVMRHPEGRVDVQLVKDYNAKLAVQEMLYRQEEWRAFYVALPKGIQSHLWNICFAVHHGYVVDKKSEHYFAGPAGELRKQWYQLVLQSVAS